MVVVADDRRPERSAANSTARKTSDCVTPNGPCMALVACNAKAPRVVTWVLCPRLAFDAAPIQPHRIVVFGLTHCQRQPVHSLEQRALLALPQPAAQPTQPLLLLPPPQPCSAPSDKHSYAPHAKTITAPKPAEPAIAPAGSNCTISSAASDAAPEAGELSRPQRRVTAFASRPQPDQVLAPCGLCPA